MKLLNVKSFLFALSFGALFTACGDDDETPMTGDVTVTNIIATGTDLQSGGAATVDLNEASAAIDVPLDATITVSFSKNVDAATVTSSNVSITQNGNDVATTVATSGSVVTINLASELERGLVYNLTLSGAIAASDGGTFSEISRSFTAAGRAGVVPPNDDAQTAFFNFDGNANSSVGGFTGSAISVAYEEDRFGNMGSAAYFDGDVSIIEVPNGDQLMTESFTLSYWMKIDTTDHINTPGTGLAGHFVMGIGGTHGCFIEVNSDLGGMKLTAKYSRDDGTTSTNDFFINADGKDGTNGGWVGVEFEEDLTGSGGFAPILQGQWNHLVFTWDATTLKRSLYLNSQLMETDNFNLTTGLLNITGMTFDDSDSGGEVIGKSLAFGFVHDIETTKWDDTPWGGYDNAGANHFKGHLDDVRFFSAPFNQAEITDLYNLEK